MIRRATLPGFLLAKSTSRHVTGRPNLSTYERGRPQQQSRSDLRLEQDSHPGSATRTQQSRIPPSPHKSSKFGPASSSSSPPSPVSSIIDTSAAKIRWEPTKKLTYAAMSALRALHETDPVKYDKADLSQRFGISYEAVSRILKSKWRGKESD